MSKYVKRLLLLTLLAGLILFGYFSYTIYQAVFMPNTAFSNSEELIFIPTGADFAEVVKRIEPLIVSKESFVVVAQRKKYDRNIKAGRYKLARGMNNNEIVNALRSNNIPVELSFNNQQSLEMLAGRAASQLEPDSLSLVLSMRDPAFLHEKGFNLDNALCMYLPNRYEFYWNVSADRFKNRMWEEYQKFWNPERRSKAATQNLDPIQAMILASIVQKEASKPEEFRRIAGLYLNRLRKGMFLQADPTVIYAMKLEKNNPNMEIKRVLNKDLEIDSPYNTYKYTGLPPGPLIMPDIPCIEAVLNPETHDYLFMVADTENWGYHKFARTLQEHNRNSQKYQNYLNRYKVFR